MKNWIQGDILIGIDGREWRFNGFNPISGLHFTSGGNEAFLTPKQAEAFSKLNPMMPSGVELQVCLEIAERQKKGFSKYGMTVENNPLDLKAWLQHSLEECLDQSIYLRRAIQQLERNESCPK